MFTVRRPSRGTIARFLQESRELPLSYEPIGIVTQKLARHHRDEELSVIGHGRLEFERACAALRAWHHFDIGWVEALPDQTPFAIGTVVAVLIRHLGFWSLNGCRVLYTVGSAEEARFGFAYGTLTNHAEAGEELFEVFLDDRTGAVMYSIRAISWPRVTLARVGQPIVRLLQARFRRHSTAAMRLATSTGVVR